ncbi:MAG: DUF2254 domain-containing protein [Planctomycetes bacterium]|nr:DUF2254 domain-containing protein [Planctomycetota bacterium]MCB9911458.1 DUF2254 domain-containing protein [Planctomycetota bacterium]
MNRLQRFWGQVRDSFWFFPSVLLALSIGFAWVMVAVDSSPSGQRLARWLHLFGVSAEGARSILSTIAGSMMTVVGVTFSMILVTLTLASSQYTSRILRNFMSDRVTQVVLGVFGAIFAYCLILLRAIRSGADSTFVPSLAVSFAMLLAIGGIVALIYFIHHIADSIQASSIIASVSAETLNAVDRLFPEELSEHPADDAKGPGPVPLSEQPWQAVPVPRNGYIQSLDSATLLRIAMEHKSIVRMEHGIGHFVVRGTSLVSVAQGEPLSDEVIADLQSAYGIARHRTVEQDTAFGIRQLVDMALRALSPGINDTTTAVMCVDYLAAILSRIANRSIPPSHRYEDGILRVVAIEPTFAGLVSESFDQICGSAPGNLSILLRMLGALHTVRDLTESVARKQVLNRKAASIMERAEQNLHFPQDRMQLAERCAILGFNA